MKKIYFIPFLFLALSLFFGCSKDILKRYDKRIQGTWALIDVDRLGWGGSTGNVPFREGSFTFAEDGQLEYINGSGEIYKGAWDMRRDWVRNQCFTNENGNYDCDDRYVHSMHVTAVNFVTQEVRAEYFDEVIFTGTNRFKAYVYTGTRNYVFRFRRQ